MSAETTSIAFLGAGRMAEAIVRGLLMAGLFQPQNIWLTSRGGRARELARELGAHAASNAEAVASAQVIVLAVKPQDIRAVLAEIGSQVTASQLVVSVAAGITLRTIEARLPNLPPVVRVMPNAPSLVQEGMSVIALGAHATAEHEQTALRILGAVGRAVVLPEHQLDAVTALSGSGPGFLAIVAEALTDAGVHVGLSNEIAQLLASQTMFGTGRMLVEQNLSPAALRDRVASPNGTTVAGINALEQAGLRAALLAAVVAATERSAELGRAAED